MNMPIGKVPSGSLSPFRTDAGSEIKHVVKTVAPTLEAVRSFGGFRTLPDYSFDTMPSDYAGLVLIGGMQMAIS